MVSTGILDRCKKMIKQKNTRRKTNSDPGLVLDQVRCMDLFIPLLRQKGKVYYKKGIVHARKAVKTEKIITLTSEGKETKNTARPGDFIITNSTKSREQYIIPPEKFKIGYVKRNDLGNGCAEYQAIGSIKAIRLDREVLKNLNLSHRFNIQAAWGELQKVRQGDMLACPPDESEIYKIAYNEFLETYG